MKKNTQKSNRLPRNFHKTFKPERHYINALLRFASLGETAEISKIAERTGIPMGASTGKLTAIIDYCKAMALIEIEKKYQGKKINLTPFGRIVLLEDPFLKYPVTQWIAHFNMCSPIRGADVWYIVFMKDVQLLGEKFKKTSLDTHLRTHYQVSKNVIGPLINMYTDEAAFKQCSALKEENNIIYRVSAPLEEEMIYGYGAWIINLIEEFFPGKQQIATVELDRLAGWKTIPFWNTSQAIKCLELLERKNIIAVDRHMEPWLITANISSDSLWGKIYSDII